MNLKDFKVQSEAEDSYHLVHPNGKTFTVQKKGLNEKAMSKIKKMSCGGEVQKLVDGGSVLPAPIRAGPGMSSADDVPQDFRYTPDQVDLARDAASQVLPTAPVVDSNALSIDPAQAAQNASADMRLSSGIDAANVPIQSTSPSGASGDWGSSPIPATTSAQDIPVQGQQPAAQPGMPDLMGQSLDKSEGAVQNYLKQMNGAAGQGAAAQNDLIKQLQAQKTPDQIFQEYKDKDDQLMQHYMDQKVDPNRYLHNMSTGSKIISAIGIALSGAGAGAHGTNLALDGINKAIANDIASQESDQSKSMNLFKMNREQSQNAVQAHAMTVNQLLTGVQAKIALASSQSQNAQANLQGQLMIQQIEQQKAQNRMRLAAMQGAMSGGDPSGLIQQLVHNPEHQKAIAGEIDTAKTVAQNRDSILSSFDDAANDNTVLKTGAGFLREPGAVKKFKQGLLPLFKDIDGTVRQAAMDETFHNLVPAPGDSGSTIQQKKDGLKNWLDSKAQGSLAKSYGINLDNFSATSPNPVTRMSPQNQRIYQIAMANPTLPQSQLALKKLGVK